MQQDLISGDALDFSTTVPNYPPSDGWTLTYRLLPQSSGTAYTFNATGSGDGQSYDVAVSSTTTVGWAAGVYSWVAYVTLAGERHVVDQGTVTIKPDPAAATSLDLRSDAAKILDQLKAALVRYSSSQGMVAEYEIAGRRMKFRSSAEILEQIRYWTRIVADEDVAARVQAGLSSGRKVYTRFLT